MRVNRKREWERLPLLDQRVVRKKTTGGNKRKETALCSRLSARTQMMFLNI